jgi:hypothetical protein
VPGGEHDFGVARRERQAGLADGVAAPPQLVPEGIAVEPQPGVKVRYRDRDRIDLMEQRSR